MQKIRYARIRMQVRRGAVQIAGQKRTMRGVIYNKELILVPIKHTDKAELKRAIKEAVPKLYDEGQLPS